MSTQTAALLAALPHPGLRELAALGHARSYPKRTIVIQEGDASDTLYIMLAGRARVYSADAEGREVVLDILGAGDMFGEMVLDGSSRSASVMTMEPSTLSVITASILRDRFRADSDLAMLLVTELVGRLRRTSRTVKQLTLTDVYERLAFVLNEEIAKSGGETTIEGMTQQDIAERIGASRDMVNRIFKELVQGGYVEVARRRISLLKPLPPHW